MEYELGITFGGEASESFANRIAEMVGWNVRITTQEGEEIEASICPTEDIGWYDAVTFLPVDDDGIAVDGLETRTVRVRNVHVY